LHCSPDSKLSLSATPDPRKPYSPSPTPAKLESLPYNESEQDDLPIEDFEDFEQSESSNQTEHKSFRMDDHFHNKDGDDWGLYVPIELTDDTTVVRPAHGIEKRASSQGIAMIGCFIARDVCRNAGFYQNCLKGAKGDYRKVTHINGPVGPSGARFAARNRYTSGVTLEKSRPCKAWPFAQRFWHYLNSVSSQPVTEKSIQTDEWPMATMNTQDTAPDTSVLHVSLRCMDNYQNNAGSRQVMNFRRGEGTYGKGTTYPDGIWVRYRTSKGPGIALALGDTYKVQFNFDHFGTYGKNTQKDQERK
jgi:hypothetical protein